MVFAVPPTESDDFLGLAESDRKIKPIGVKNGQSKTQNLILRGANVSGRIMYAENTQWGAFCFTRRCGKFGSTVQMHKVFQLMRIIGFLRKIPLSSSNTR